MPTENNPNLALFYCQHTPESGEGDRQSLEAKYGKSLRLFPMPCSSRIEPIHLLRALEEFADAVYVITCPEGECRYSDGNLRARKRVQRVREAMASIGLKGDRVGLVMNSRENPKSLARLLDEIMVTFTRFEPSPMRKVPGQ